MKIDALTQHILADFSGSHVQIIANGDRFFFIKGEDKFPFATIVTGDNDYDNLSNLNREGFFRLNMGVGKEVFRQLFPEEDAVHDFTAQHTLFPHPMYHKLFWISIINPAAYAPLRQFLTSAWEKSVRKPGW
jgi:hypothetical protein